MRVLVIVMLVAGVVSGFAQTPAAPETKPQQTVSSVLDRSLSGAEKEFVDLADAMPEAKYDFVPTTGDFKGVRNFGEQAKHVADANYFFSATILGEKPPEGSASLKTKAEIMKYVRESFAYAHKAFASITDKNLVEEIKFGRGSGTRLGIGTMLVSHVMDHYGQMVEYVRMNGIIPPASRK